MNKLWLIIQREYLSRVKKKTFILTTILTPIGIVIFWVSLIFIMSSGVEKKKVALLDPHNVLNIEKNEKLRDGMIMFGYPDTKLADLKQNYQENGYRAIISIPEQTIDSTLKNFEIEFYSKESLGINTESNIKDAFYDYIEEIKMEQLGLRKEALNFLKTKIKINPKLLGEEADTEEEVSSHRAKIATALGGIMMFLIYLVIFIYGNMVMRSVMEEKTNRIVEVLISSVKPFQLMLGKIVGVGAVGLTQFAIWAAVFPLLYLGVGFIFAGKLAELQQVATTSTASSSGDMSDLMGIWQELQNFDYAYIFMIFLIFFLGGYILYASLFAAVGAAMGDDWGEGQSLTLVVAIPVVIAFYIGIAVIENPTSTLATWSSMFPLFSPIVMPARIVFDPPMWQIVASIVILIMTCLLFIWISGRIYRIGILMYGKKTTFREFVQWMFRRD